MIKALLNEDEYTQKNDICDYIYLYAIANLHAYGTGYDFIDFYCSDNGAVLSLEGARGYLYLPPNADNAEMQEFATAVCSSIYTNLPLDGCKMQREEGTCFKSEGLADLESPAEVTEEIAQAYCILAEVFPETVNKQTYMNWYADMSHRLRHNKAFVYSISRKSTITIKAIEGNYCLALQIATAKKYRRCGMAERLIKYAAYTHKKEILLASQTEKSDSFYRHIGFKEAGRWYRYYKSEEQE